MLRVALFFVLHAMKIGTIICILILLCTLDSIKIIADQSTAINLLIVSVLIIILKLIFGGWCATSIKGMIWSVVLSSLGSILLVGFGMKTGGGSISYFMLFLPMIVATVLGLASGQWVENLASEATAKDLDAETLVNSVMDNGLKNTFNGVIDIFEGNVYYAASRGVAVYSNVSIILGLILNIYYR